MKLADRFPNKDVLTLPQMAYVRDCIKAREREAEQLVEASEWARNAARAIGEILSEVHPDAPGAKNREAVDKADRFCTGLRAQILAVRRAAKTIADRDAREENGVLKP